MNLLTKLPKRFASQVERLRKKLSPHTTRAYIVGGTVRDLLLENPIKDLDIEIYDIAPDAFDGLMNSWGAKGVGKSFFVYKWHELDLALPRSESKIARGHQGFSVRYCNDEKEASSRRDFTMNAMMINIFDGSLQDHWGGQRDIALSTIRLIREDAFSEDPLRVLRGVQFAARFGFLIEGETERTMKKMDLSELSHTRIFWEMEKLFRAPHLHLGLLYMYKLDLFEKLLHVRIEARRLFVIAREMKACQPYFEDSLRSYYFLYFLVHRVGADMKKVLEILHAPNAYHKALVNVPFEEEGISDVRLATIAIERPLKEWVGLCRKGWKERAVKLGLYDEVFTGGVTSKEVIDDGFSGANIRKEMERRKREKAKMTRREIGSMTARGGFINESDICKKFINFRDDEDARIWLSVMGYEAENIQQIEATHIPVRINKESALRLGVSEEAYEETLKFKKADIQVRVSIMIDNVLHVENISLKKSNTSAGFNQVDKRPVSTYQAMWGFNDEIAKWLRAFTGAIRPHEIHENLLHVRDHRRLFMDEIPQAQRECIIDFFTQNKSLIVMDILRGRGSLSVEWFLVTRKNGDVVDWVLKDINRVCNFYAQGNVEITPRGSLKMGRVTVQRKGGTPDPTSLQFKINPLELFGA